MLQTKATSATPKRAAIKRTAPLLLGRRLLPVGGLGRQVWAVVRLHERVTRASALQSARSTGGRGLLLSWSRGWPGAGCLLCAGRPWRLARPQVDPPPNPPNANWHPHDLLARRTCSAGKSARAWGAPRAPPRTTAVQARCPTNSPARSPFWPRRSAACLGPGGHLSGGARRPGGRCRRNRPWVARGESAAGRALRVQCRSGRSPALYFSFSFEE